MRVIKYVIFLWYCTAISQGALVTGDENFTGEAFVKKYFFRDGIPSKEYWYNAEHKKIDSLKTYYSTGKLNEVFYYNNGRCQGKCYKYSRDGKLMVTWDFENGILQERTDHFILFNEKNETKIKTYHNKLKELNAKLKRTPRSIKLQYQRAIIRSRLGNHVLALRTFKNIARIYKKIEKKREIPAKFYGNLYDNIGSIYANYEMDNHAIHYKFLAVKRNPEQTRLKYNLGGYLVDLKLYDLAEEYLNEVLEVWPNHAFTHRALAVMYSDLKKYKTAKKHIDIAFSKEAQLLKLGSAFYTRNIRTTRGLILHKLGDSEQGILDLEEAIKINKDNAFAYRNLGVVYNDLKQYEQSCKMLQKAKSLGYEEKYDFEDLNSLMKVSCNRKSAKEIKLFKKEKPIVFPNPAVNEITLKGVDDPNFKYKLYSFDARLVKTGSAEGYKIEITNLSAGLYLLNVNGISIRFIKK